MSHDIVSCPACGQPLTLPPGQAILRCPSCRGRYWNAVQADPQFILESRISLSDARQVVKTELQARQFEKGFSEHSAFEKGTLYLIPLYEIRGVQAGKIKKEIQPVSTDQEPTMTQMGLLITRHTSRVLARHGDSAPLPHPELLSSTFAYNSFQFLSLANDCRVLEIGLIDTVHFEDCMLAATPEDMRSDPNRRRGIVLPINKPRPDTSAREKSSLKLIEQATRIVFFPVWEIAYCHGGLVYKSYLDAIRGVPLKTEGLAPGRKSLWQSLMGLSFLGVCTSLALKSGWIPAIVFSFIIFATLFPFFWEMFQFREILERRPEGDCTRPIAYSENWIIRHLKKLDSDWNRRGHDD